MLQIATTVLLIGTYLRVILVFVSLNKPGVCKVYFALETAMVLADSFLVTCNSSNLEDQVSLLKMTNLVFGCYYNFLPSLAAVAIKLICHTAFASLLHSQTRNDSIKGFFFLLTLHVMLLIVAHIVTTAAGLVLTDA